VRTRVRGAHRLLGLALLLPFIGWAATGLVFFIKPGYGGAYEPLSVKTYPMQAPIAFQPDPAWREMRYLRTVLGGHVLARTDAGWSHLDAATLRPVGPPTSDQVRTLVADAISGNPARYGSVRHVSGSVADTDTGARVTLDWDRMTLQQRGTDTDLIDGIYRIHYLQWTGVGALDKVLGFAGLAMMIALTALGARLALRP